MKKNDRLEIRIGICLIIWLAVAFIYIKHLSASIHMNGDTYDMVGFMVYPDTNEKLYIPVYRRR